MRCTCLNLNDVGPDEPSVDPLCPAHGYEAEGGPAASGVDSDPLNVACDACGAKPAEDCAPDCVSHVTGDVLWIVVADDDFDVAEFLPTTRFTGPWANYAVVTAYEVGVREVTAPDGSLRLVFPDGEAIDDPSWEDWGFCSRVPDDAVLRDDVPATW